jgi:hypothetical protein
MWRFLLRGLGGIFALTQTWVYLTAMTAKAGAAFLPIQLDYLGEYVLPDQVAGEVIPIGGLSGISYDAPQDVFYAISDDRSEFAPARFYQLKLQFDQTPKIAHIQVQQAILLKNKVGETYAKGILDPEGIWLSPQGTAWISSEGVAREAIAPFVHEVDRRTGQFIRSLPFPSYYNPKLGNDGKTIQQGVRDNEAFESLTGFTDRSGKTTLFVATEYALAQDVEDDTKRSASARVLRYVIEQQQARLAGEYIYPLDLRPLGAVNHGLVDLMAIDEERLLSLERSYGRNGFTLKLFQLTLDGATEFSAMPTVKGQAIVPIRKQLLLNLQDLGISLDNYEGVILGPKLSDASQSLIIVSDNNFNPNQRNSFLLFRIAGLP